MSNATPTLSWQPAPRRWHSPPWIDPGLKVLIPALVIVFVVLAVKFGSIAAHGRLRAASWAVSAPPLRELFVTAPLGLYAKWDKAGILRCKAHGKDDLTIFKEEA